MEQYDGKKPLWFFFAGRYSPMKAMLAYLVGVQSGLPQASPEVFFTNIFCINILCGKREEKEVIAISIMKSF